MMKAARLSLARLLLACLCFAGWTFATNQCALGLVSASQTQAEVGESCAGEDACGSGCVFEDKRQDADANSATCLARCGEMRLALPPSPVSPTLNSAHFALVLFSVASDVPPVLTIVPSSASALDTGPPFAFSFAELVLHGSLPAIAPPYVG